MTPTRSSRAQRPAFGRGFTMVEMLLVIGIIMLLMAIMLPALSGVQKRSRKMVELNHLRQIGMAWTMYANQHNDAAIPGYLDPNGLTSVQKAWRVRYEYPSLPTGQASQDPTIPDEVSAAWTWRLAPFIDYNAEVLWGYRGDATNDVQFLVDNAQEVAFEPAFGYNAYYIGGWWRVTPGETIGGESTSTRARPSFYDAAVNTQNINVVVRTLSTMTRPEQLVVFCSSTRQDQTGLHSGLHDDVPGSHLVTPPTVGMDNKWRIPAIGGGGGDGSKAVATSDRFTIEVFETPAHVPTARHNRFNAVLYGDGTTDTVFVSDLYDQRRWINGPVGMDRFFSHQGTYWE